MKAEKARLFVHVNTGFRQDEKRIASECYAEITELERLASEYQSPETQRLIEIGRAVEAQIAVFGGIEIGGSWDYDSAQFRSTEDLLEFNRNCKEDDDDDELDILPEVPSYPPDGAM